MTGLLGEPHHLLV